MQDSIVRNVIKMLSCKTNILGHHLLKCDKCGYERSIPHTCKPRLCTSCGKKQTDKWLRERFEVLPDTRWQHITFTMPDLLWYFFWYNRHLIGLVPKITAEIILDLVTDKAYLPCLFLSIHLLGEDFKNEFHKFIPALLFANTHSEIHPQAP